MTTAASLGNVCAIDRRLRIVRRQHRRHVAILSVAIKARRCLDTVANCLRMKAVVVTGVRAGVKAWGEMTMDKGKSWTARSSAIAASQRAARRKKANPPDTEVVFPGRGNPDTEAWEMESATRSRLVHQ